ncbi:hypothetical protein K438DRAFT_1786572 [Mycena galopus ATCC 62051]|nr:hypothetical protein K438DRAFT_1786572 [Mycena galopus ATCC 62051]
MAAPASACCVVPWVGLAALECAPHSVGFGGAQMRTAFGWVWLRSNVHHIRLGLAALESALHSVGFGCARICTAFGWVWSRSNAYRIQLGSAALKYALHSVGFGHAQMCTPFDWVQLRSNTHCIWLGLTVLESAPHLVGFGMHIAFSWVQITATYYFKMGCPIECGTSHIQHGMSHNLICRRWDVPSTFVHRPPFTLPTAHHVHPTSPPLYSSRLLVAWSLASGIYRGLVNCLSRERQPFSGTSHQFLFSTWDVPYSHGTSHSF